MVIDDRVIYFDTDSIICSLRKGDIQPIQGDFIGELTNEIDKSEGNYIQEFISAGSKNYAYKLDSGFTKCTIKGFSLNYIRSLTWNFDPIREIIIMDWSKRLQTAKI